MRVITALAIASLLAATTGAAVAAPPPPPPPPGPHFSFGFGFGPTYPPYPYPHHQHFYSDCLSTDEIYAGLADDGYYRVRVVDESRGQLIVNAIRHHQPVRLVVDRCSGNVTDEHPIYY